MTHFIRAIICKLKAPGFNRGGFYFAVPVIRQSILKLCLVFLAVQHFPSEVYSQVVVVPYNASGTFTVPANVTNITVECWGGGGGGGSTQGRRYQAAGGGAGGSYIRHNTSVTPGAVFNVVVGAGGAAITNGQSSYLLRTSPVDTVVLARGGIGGTRPTNSDGNSTTYRTSLGAQNPLVNSNIPASGFLQSLIGNPGGDGTNTPTISSGSGGNGAGAAGGAGGAGIPASTSAGSIGNPGIVPGGGGGGAINNNNNTARAGGAGAAGRVIITYCTFSLTSTGSSSICQGNPAVVNLSSSASSLPAGSYVVTYNLSGSNVATGLTANMTVSVAGSGSFNTTNLANPGNTGITITSLQSGGCSNPISTNNSTTINIQAEAAISYPQLSYCAGTALVIPVTQTGPSGGSYSANPSGLSINPTTGSIDIAASSPGIYTVNYTYSGGCGSSASTQISIVALPVMNCPANMGTCLSAAPFILTGASPVGGTYSGPGVSGGLFNPAAAGIGTHTITYTFTNASNCTSTCSFTITVVNSVPTISATPASSYVYSGNAAVINLSSPVSGTLYTWTASANSSSVTGFSSQGSPVPGPISQTLFNQGTGIGEVTYSITPSLTGCSGTPISVFINLPATTFCQSPGTFQPGSCIINMGITPQTEGNGLKPFGLLYQLINVNNIPVYWAINPNKSFVDPLNKVDQVDFSVDGINFRGGAFIIPAPYVPQVQSLINAWVAQGVVVHYAGSSFSPPVYDILTRIPKVVLDADNGHLVENAFYIKAGIPSAAYTKGGIPSQINVCEDVYVLPHADPQDWPQTQKDSLYNFINARGWFFSGCHAVSAIESNTGMRFLSNNGLILWTAHADPILPYSYSLQPGNEASNIASDPLMQFVGKVDGALNGGSEEIYVPSSGWRPTTKVAVFDSNYVNNSINYPNTAAAVVYGRAYGDPNKGIVMYVGGHSLQHGTTAENVAAARLYGNFLLRSGIGTRPRIIPVSIPATANAGDTLTLSVNVPTGVSPIVSAQWTSDLNGIFLSQSATTQFIVPNVDAATFCTVQYRVTDACGRVGLFCAIISITPTIKNNYVGASQSVCASATPASLTGTVPVVINGGSFSYEWLMSTTGPTSGFSPAPGINNLQQYSPGPVSQTSWFRRRVFTASGISVVSSVIQISLIPGPAINTQPSTASQSTCQGGTLAALTVAATGTGLSYQWYSNSTASNAGGTLVSGATASSYTPSTALQGTLYYYCIITDANGCSSTSQVSGAITITASLLILTHPSTANVTICQGAPLSALSVNVNGTNVTYQWFYNTAQSNIGGTAITGATSASYTPDLLGSFYYYCVVVAPGSCSPAVRRSNPSGLVTILPRPVPVITNNSGTNILTCLTTNISLAGSGGASYTWSNSEGDAINGANLVVANPDTYTLTVTGANGCKATASITISQDITAPNAGIQNQTGTNIITCVVPSIQLNATGIGNFSWSDGVSVIGNGASVSVSNGGNYTLTVTGSNGCSASQSVSISTDTLSPVISVNNQTGTNELTCLVTQINLEASGGASYTWSLGATQLSNSNSVSISQAGTYSLTLTASNGCTSDTSLLFTANQVAPVVSIQNNTGTTVLNCENNSISLQANGAANVEWTDGTQVIGNGASIILTAAGNYTATGTAANGCTAQASVSITENLSEHKWIATPDSTDFYWDNPLNWCGGVPTDSTDAYIPDTGAPPVISRSTGSVRNIRFDAGAVVYIDGDTLRIFGNISSNGNINAINGSIDIAGKSTAQIISGNQFDSKRINHLRISNAQGVQLDANADTLYITGQIDFGKENATLATNGLLTLASGPSHTASVGNMSLYSGNRITGSVTVERFIPDHPKAWQFLAVPTTGQTIRESWQEGNAALGNSKPGYGTIITSNLATAGNMLGFDLYSAGGPSMKTYHPATNSWVGVPSTNIPIANDKGYMLFVRGDRSVTAFNQAATVTRLRTSGQLYTPLDNPPPTIVVPTDQFVSVGNPYASAIDFGQLTKTGGLQDVFYLWDPKLTSSAQGSVYGLGNYRTFIRDGAIYKAIPPDVGGTYGNANHLIQSGQAFFVRATGSDGSLSFAENAKTSGSTLFTRQGSPVSSYLSVNLSVISNNVPVLTDGILLECRNGYSNGIDALDALKMVNTGAENLGILSNSRVLAAERRNLPGLRDTIFLQTGQLKQRTYQFDFQPENFPAGFEAWLVDHFTGASYPVNLLYDNPYQFTVSSDARSAAANRFILIISSGKRPQTAGPSIQLHSIQLADNQRATLKWQPSKGHNFVRFIVEREENNGSFSELLFLPAKRNNRAEPDDTEVSIAGDRSRFRIKGIDANGQVTYSRVAEVSNQDERNDRSISIYPNPTQGREITLTFNSLPEGDYLVKISGTGGELLASFPVMIGKNDRSKKLSLDPAIPAGSYILSLIAPDGKVTALPFIKR